MSAYESGSPNPKHTKLRAKEWAEIEALWALGEVTLDQLSERYGVTTSHLSRRLAKKGVKKGSRAVQLTEDTEKAIREGLKEDAKDLSRKIRETKNEHYEWVRNLSRVLYAKIAQAVQAKKPIGDLKDDVRALKDAISALGMARNDRYALLGLDKDPDLDDEMPRLIVEDMTADDIEEARAARTEELDAELGIDDLDSLSEKLDERLKEEAGGK